MKVFSRLMQDERFKNLPMVLETPVKDGDDSIYAKEIALLYGTLAK